MPASNPSRIGVLLVNLGTPDAPTTAALRPYLQQFLSDPRVIEIPRAAWLPILHGIILRTRPAQSAKKYALVWTKEGAPLRVHTERQTKLLRAYLGDKLKDAPLVVEYAMRYGNPSIPDVLAKLQEQNCDRILVLPLYPQYAASSTASTIDEVLNVLATERNQPALRTVKHFHDHPGYIAALAQNIRDYWMNHGHPDQLVLSFHGVPKFTYEKGDPYYDECLITGKLIAEALHLREDQYKITFQSRFGRAEWLKPYTAATLEQLGKQKTKRVDVFCPGFVADCLETLEEIGMEVRTLFLNAGGGEYHHIPCLNERADWIHALTDIAVNELRGWAD